MYNEDLMNAGQPPTAPVNPMQPPQAPAGPMPSRKPGMGAALGNAGNGIMQMFGSLGRKPNMAPRWQGWGGLARMGQPPTQPSVAQGSPMGGGLWQQLLMRAMGRR